MKLRAINFASPQLKEIYFDQLNLSKETEEIHNKKLIDDFETKNQNLDKFDFNDLKKIGSPIIGKINSIDFEINKNNEDSKKNLFYQNYN